MICLNDGQSGHAPRVLVQDANDYLSPTMLDVGHLDRNALPALNSSEERSDTSGFHVHGVMPEGPSPVFLAFFE